MSNKLTLTCIDLLNASLKSTAQELNEIDWKLKMTDDGKEFIKHLSAFANYRGGGFIVFGINDRDGNIVGLDQLESKVISDKLSNLARTSLSPRININPFTFEYRKKNLLAIHIDESPDRPVHPIRGDKVGTPYIRAGGTSRPMDRNEIRNAYISTRPLRFEELLGVLPENIKNNWIEYFDFTPIVERLKAGPFSSDNSLNEFLYVNKLLTKINGEYAPTNLAIITSSKNFKWIPNCEKYGIRLLEYRGVDKLETIRDEEFHGGYAHILDNLMKRIIELLPHNEIIEKATRTNLPIIPEIAIRELIANAIIHRNFTTNESCIYVEIYKDRIEITNPGNLLPGISVDRLIDHPSSTRNEVLADLMRKLRFAEERGSGIDKAVLACEIYGLPPILFTNGQDYFKVTLYCPKSFTEMDKEDRLNAVYQHTCLNQVMNKKTTNKSIRHRLKFSDKQNTKVYRLISDAIESKKIKVANPSDAKKNYHYLPYWI